MKCPKCGYENKDDAAYCGLCGEVFNKEVSKPLSDEKWGMLKDVETLIVEQEVLFQPMRIWEKKEYFVSDSNGKGLYKAVGNWSLPGQGFFQFSYQFTLDVRTLDGRIVLELVKPVWSFFPRLEAFDAKNKPLGIIRKRFSVLRRVYSVLDASGHEIFQLFGPILHPWTFQIMKGGFEIGKITKKWSGFLKEQFTRADNFAVIFPRELDVVQKSLLMGAVFLIDLIHFEKKK